MTPLQAIRSYCVNCVGGRDHLFEVRSCGGNKIKNGGSNEKDVCFFYKFRMCKGRPSVRLIRKMCLHCMCGSRIQIEECNAADCPLHPFRFGTNPNITEETREMRREMSKNQLAIGGMDGGVSP